MVVHGRPLPTAAARNEGPGESHACRHPVQERGNDVASVRDAPARCAAASPLEQEEILSTIEVDHSEDRRYFILEGPGFAGWVVAGVMVTVEDEGEYYEPSPLLD